MNVLSLFSGVGGFDLGLENAGMKTIYQCEWDKHANSILERHWPTVPRWGDISTLTAKEILRHGTPPDVVAWGSPCQDLSVAGKRAGLEGERSGLFHEGIRIINELRKETNNEYPKISIWENVAGALSSNRGADFGVILDEMAKAGAMVIEWALLDAQHFGIPQRRRRVFCIAIFDSATADRCPDPLLPVTESVRGNTAKGKPKRQSAARTLTEGTGAGSGIVNAIGASLYHHGTVVNQDADAGHMVVEEDQVGTFISADLVKGQCSNQSLQQNFLQVTDTQAYTSSSYAEYTEGVGTLRSNGGDLGGGSETLIAEPYVKSRRAQTSTDDETWVHGEVNPTLNSYRDGARIAKEGITQTLSAKMGTGGGNTPMVALPLSFDTQFGSNANVTENVAPTLKSSQQAPSVAYSIREDAKANTFSATELDHANALSALRPSPQSHHAQMFIAQPMAVRRLTPLECERLMGWPDDHTRYKADGTEQADTHRYKQCGNGVASSVAEWIGKQLMKLETSLEG